MDKLKNGERYEYIHHSIIEAEKINLEKWFFRAAATLALTLLFCVVLFVLMMLNSIRIHGFVNDYEMRARVVEECLAADVYTREECFMMAGSMTSGSSSDRR